MRIRVVIPIIVVLLSGSLVGASALQDRMERDLEGAWGVLRTEVYSNCSGIYNDNDVRQSGVHSKASRRFEAGEIVRIDKVKVKRSRVDLLLTLSEPILRGSSDGPFTLYSEASCKVQLIFEVPRQWIKTGDHRRILSEIDEKLTTFDSYETARTSPLWNGRERDPYPEDYEDTLIRHEIWKAEQLNLSIEARADEALETALRIARNVDDDPRYLKGFADGSRNLNRWSENDCERLLSVSFSSVSDHAPRDSEGAYKDGFRDGQELVFSLILARRLQGCFVVVPPPPPED